MTRMMTLAAAFMVGIAMCGESARAQAAFTHQGKLTNSGTPVTGPVDLAFRLYDAAGAGSQIGSEVAFPSFTGFDADGLFTVDLDFGAGAFDGSDRWLEIWVDGAALSPRQKIMPAPYALFALDGGTGGWTDKGADVHTMANVGIGTTTPLYRLHVQSDGSRAIFGVDVAASGITQAIYGEANSTQGTGVYGHATALTGLATGVIGKSAAGDGRGVYGQATATSGMSYGGAFHSYSTEGTGAMGVAFAATGNTYGVRGLNYSTTGIGVHGRVQAANGLNFGVWGESASTTGRGVYGLVDATSGVNFGVVGQSYSSTGRGVYGAASGTSGANYGVWGNASGDSGTGVYGRADSLTGTTYGVHGVTYSPDGFAGYFDGAKNYFGGNVGIGTTTPGAKLHVNRDTAGTVVSLSGNGGGTGIALSGNSIGVSVAGLSSTGTALSVPSVSGSARAASFYGSSSNDMLRVQNDGTGAAIQALGASDASPSGGGLIIAGSETSLNIAIDNNEIMARNNGAGSTLWINADGGDVAIGSNSGGTVTLITPVLQITGGADLSEMFDVDGEAEARPGTVVVIDAEHPGRLSPSTSAYDARVAGIISGAGGVATGMRMGHDGTVADGEHPVALSGRVYCLVDATEHGIRPGDMLTTSDTPGHAMKVVDRSRAYGAVIGKAMTTLEQGEKGLVLVLVNLQ